MLTANPRQLLDHAPAKAVILGSNRFEFGIDRSRRDSFVTRSFERNAAAARTYYRLNEADPPADPRLGTLDDQISTDVHFRCPTAHMAHIMAAKGAAVWQYEFDAAPGGGRTSHAAEIPYAFGSSTFGRGQSLKPYWVNFIRSGDPNGAGLSRWPAFTPRAQQHVLFDAKGVTIQGPLRPQLCSLENRL